MRRALRDNHVVNKALGVLMGFLRIPERKAFEALVARASARNVKAVALAGEIIEACETLSETGGTRERQQQAVVHVQQARAILNRFTPGRHS